MPNDPDSQIAANRRTYGRGFADGLKHAGVMNIGEIMSQKKLLSALANTHGIERKVWESMPIDRTVRAYEIVNAIAKNGGAHEDVATVERCLHSLTEKGLANAPTSGNYKRVTLKPEYTAPAPAATVVDRSPAPEIPDRPKMTPLDKLADLQNRATKLAAELTDVGIEVAQMIQDAKPKTRTPAERLREMLELLED